MTILITGASRGIGKAIAEKFAAAHYDVIICSRNKSALDSTVSEIEKAVPGARVKAYEVDLTNKASVSSITNQLLTNASIPDVLVNNAGQFIPGSIHNEEEGTLEKMVEVNLYSAYHLTRALLPAMMERRSGHIFNMCSIASLHAYENGGSYSISKFALLGFSKNLREEMKPFRIKVTAILPGATMTDSWAGSGVEPDRIMEAADVANLVYAATQLSPMAVVEDIVLRPQLGDL